ncbi:MAG: DNA primase [Synergistetes bacterium]|nr:DNA primase [Synergistota bacterium]
MKIYSELIEEVRKRNDIVDVISEYVSLKKAGKNYKALCPFHSEKTPSFIVSPDKQIFHCFGCGVGGDVIGFIMRIEKTSFQDAVLRLAERAGISLKELDPSTLTREAREREKLYKLNELAASFFESKLWSEEGSEALSYLKRRGLESSTIKAFRIGYSPSSGDALTNFMVDKGFYPEELSRAGLATIYLDGRCYDKFRGRIMFPICDERGRILGFGGRSLEGEEPKYLNSPETLIFSKKRILFGLDKALNYIKSCGELVLVEGYMDMIKLFQAGIRFVVASLGTSLTEAQVNTIARHVGKVFVAYDADFAGESATIRGVSLLVSKGLEVRVVSIPSGMDPDEFVSRYGGEAFISLLENASNFWDFRLDAIFKDFDPSNIESKRIALKRGIDFLLELSDIDRSFVIPKLSEKLGLSENSIKKVLSSKIKKSKVKTYLPQTSSKSGFQKAEEDAILVLMKNPGFKNKFLEYGGLDLFEDEKIRWIAERILEGYSEYKIMEEAEGKEDLSGLVSYLILKDLPCSENKIELYFEGLLRSLLSRRVKKRLDEIEEKLRKEGMLPPSLYSEYLKLLKELQKGRCLGNGRRGF